MTTKYHYTLRPLTEKDGGGYLCGASHVVRHDVPVRNLMAFVEAVREYGEPPPLPAKPV